ncbi:ubiquitin family protein [Priestia flexa]|uniref:Uncharacterized protein n=1 Tax=Priestia flexa TaxID=86664 RepID=A0ABU4J0T6_9BACI|nr:hypothetical protein [Priestia flexa]MDW8514885.1 hypothetical protein [Priestia flexa]
MSLSKKIGDQHVIEVSEALKCYLLNQPISNSKATVQQTVRYITDMYPTIKSVRSKFETPDVDFNPDLLIELESNETKKINLFYIKGSSPVQPKNLGAKSFLKKYFLREDLQDKFNEFFEVLYKSYLREIVNTREEGNVYDDISSLKKKVKEYYPNFDSEINSARRQFLFAVREACFTLLTNEYNNKSSSSIANAINELLLINSINIITRHSGENKCLGVEELKFNGQIDKINLYKKGQDTIGIRAGQEALTLRFKFESKPTSSIKLATSYEKFPDEESIIQRNLDTIKQFEGIIANHKQSGNNSNISNAIGKCNEAMVYYQILKSNPAINQVSENDYKEMLNQYAPVIATSDLLAIHNSSYSALNILFEYLKVKYPSYSIDSIQLVGDNYLKNRLDTSDLNLILIVNDQYIEESISLKALGKKTTKLTSKNPGVGTILGSQYFDIGSLSPIVFEVKEKFQNNVFDHYQSLIEVSTVLGDCLAKANQINLKKGVKALIGEATMLITFYKQNHSIMLDHKDVRSEIKVYPHKPSQIQTTLSWNNNQEELCLRIKFSAGQSRGWSSLKLACEYKIQMF